jgi:hypothetical protein
MFSELEIEKLKTERLSNPSYEVRVKRGRFYYSGLLFTNYELLIAKNEKAP